MVMMTRYTDFNGTRYRPIRILLVEDNPAHTKLILRALEDDKLGNTVQWVSDGNEALQYLLQRGKYQNPESCPRPDIIFLDLKLPEVNGIQVLETVKTDPSLRTIPVIVLTSSDDELDIRLSLKNRADSFHSKPVDFDKFRQLVQDVAFYWTVWNGPHV